MEQRERIARVIEEYDGQGVHRTATEVDDRSAEWLADQVRAIGLEPVLEPYDVDRVDPGDCHLEIGGRRIEGVPLHDGGFTDAGGIDGELCEDDDEDPFGKIVLATSALRNAPEWADRELPTRIEELIDRGCVGLILPQGDRDGEIVLRNAHRIDAPQPLPVLQIARRDAGTLQAQIVIRGEVILEADGERLRSNATNVIATIEGSDPDATPIGIVTPKSGWYTCAAERGGGIAIFLALAESLAAARPRRTVHLLASSGHELDFYGIRAYARIHRANIAGAAAWLHLGASIGAREAKPAVAASDEALDAAVTQAIGAERLEPATHRPPDPALGGEALVISELDTRYVSFLGGHPYFHSPNDVVAKAVDEVHIARWARASREVLSALLALEGEGS